MARTFRRTLWIFAFGLVLALVAGCQDDATGDALADSVGDSPCTHNSKAPYSCCDALEVPHNRYSCCNECMCDCHTGTCAWACTLMLCDCGQGPEIVEDIATPEIVPGE